MNKMITRLSKKLNRTANDSPPEKDLRLTLASAINQTADGIMITDKAMGIRFVNHAFEALTGYTLVELLDKNPKIFKSGGQTKDFYRDMWRALSKGESFRAVILNRNKSGGLFYIDETITPLKDLSGEVSHYVAIWRDVTAQKKSEALILHQAYHDIVTGLPNRLLLKDRIDQAITVAKRNGRHIAVLFLDLDRFKEINDTYGHSSGDQLLSQVGQRIFNVIRETDTVSRIGGDEFVILLNQIETDVDAIKVAELVLRKLREDFVLEGKVVHTSASVGIAIYPQNGLSSEALFKSADIALYQAKGHGRNNFQLFIGDTTI